MTVDALALSVSAFEASALWVVVLVVVALLISLFWEGVNI